MRILFWTNSFWPEIGGLEVFCANLMRALRNRGHILEIITDREHGMEIKTLQFEGVTVHGFPFQHLLDQGGLKSIPQLHEACTEIVNRFQPDVIHMHGLGQSLYLFLLLQKRKCPPTVITLHDNLRGPGFRAIDAQALEKMARITTVSEYIRRQVLEFDSRFESRTQTVLNALPDPEITISPLPIEHKILAPGRLERHKGFDLAINAFAGIAAQFPNATLTLAGDGPDRDPLQKIADDSGFGDRIHFTGWLLPEKMPSLFNQHSVVIVPSRWQEPFGLVALEAAQMGRPVIASRAGGLPEIVEDDVTGMLFENGNLAGLTEALRRLLSDPALAARMGDAARVRASAFFKFDRFVDRYEEIYNRALLSKN